MALTQEQLALLEEKLDAALIANRKQGSQTLSYLEAVDVIRAANKVFGQGNWGWQADGLPVKVASGLRQARDNNPPTEWAVWAVNGKLVIDGCVVMTGTGAAVQASGAPESIETAIKAADTDAMKRALKNYGDQFGLVLYDKEDVRDLEREAAAEERARQQEQRDRAAGGFRGNQGATNVQRAAAANEAPAMSSIYAWKQQRLFSTLTREEMQQIVAISADGEITGVLPGIAEAFSVERNADRIKDICKKMDGAVPSFIAGFIMNDDPAPLSQEHVDEYFKSVPWHTAYDLITEGMIWASNKLARADQRAAATQWVEKRRASGKLE